MSDRLDGVYFVTMDAMRAESRTHMITIVLFSKGIGIVVGAAPYNKVRDSCVVPNNIMWTEHTPDFYLIDKYLQVKSEIERATDKLLNTESIGDIIKFKNGKIVVKAYAFTSGSTTAKTNCIEDPPVYLSPEDYRSAVRRMITTINNFGAEYMDCMLSEETRKAVMENRFDVPE